MSLISKVSSYMSCCFRVHQPDEDEFSANLNTLNARSPISVHLPASTVPHASSKRKDDTRDDDEALRDIFRSTCSVRGYQTASEPMQLLAPGRPSFDADFKFGAQESEKKPTGRLEQLGSHIKQRLSEGRLSKTNSVHQDISEDTGQKPSLGLDNTEASMTQKSNGLLELLMSRTGSERGYDSDAKSIHTMILRANDPTTRSSPSAAKELANALDVALPSPPSPSCPEDESDQLKAGAGEAANDDLPLPLPAPTSFTDALLAERDSIPTVALKRLSASISNGTVKLPSPRNSIGSLNHIAGKDRTSAGFMDLSPAEATYNTEQQIGILSTLNRLGNTVAAAQRDSLSSLPDSNLRASIVSSLDPTFIDFISRFAELDHSKHDSCLSEPSGDPDPTITGEKIFSSIPNNSSLYVQKEDDHSGREPNSCQVSDQASVHLYNMRISQNLASPSLAAYTSRPTTSHTTVSDSKPTSKELIISTKRQSTDSYLPRRATTEHNRRPSDPQTRRIFEHGDTTDKMLSQRKTVISYNTGVNDLNMRRVRAGDDGSSFYPSDNEPNSGASSLRIPSWRNANSLAIGGRSESISFPVSFSKKSIDIASETGEDMGVRRNDLHSRRGNSQRSRSSSMPVSITPQHLYLVTRNRNLNCTEDNEKLSEISTAALEDSRRENLTEISAQAIHDARNESMSEIDHTTVLEKGDRDLPLHSSVLSGQRQSSSGSKDVRTHWQRRRGSNSGATPDLCHPKLLESTTDMWQRTFRQAAAEPHDENMVGFFFTPRYDRDGRRRKSKASSLSNTERDENDPTTGRSHANSEQPQVTFNMGREPSVGQGQLATLPTLMENNNTRKKSLLDLGRMFTATVAKGGSETRSENTTHLQDILGL